MKLLIVYHLSEKNIRNTIKDHLYSFRKFSRQNCFYLNVAFGVPKYILNIDFDIIIYHYTITSQKTTGQKEFRKYLDSLSLLKNIKGFKTVLPQDEFHYTDEICKFYKEFMIDMVFNVFPDKAQNEWRRLFPLSSTGVKHYKSVLTGYAIEPPEEIDDSIFSLKHKTIDIGYRARKLGFYTGRTGFYKWKITEVFLDKTKKTDLIVDISNDPKKTILGTEWNKFLKSCRIVLCTESGASIHDKYGRIEENVNKFISKYKNVTFEEIEKIFLLDNNIHINFSMISPKVFEAIEAGACLVMTEGDYNNVVKPNIHYIQLKKDFSNIEEVIQKIGDKKYCHEMARRTYEDIIMSGKYSYSFFVNYFIDEVKSIKGSFFNEKIELSVNENIIYNKLIKRETRPYIYATSYYIKVNFENLIILIVNKMRLKNSLIYKFLKFIHARL